MQRYDFTQLGGFPLTQDRLKWMQEGYIDAINALGAMCNTSVPVTLSGITLVSGTWANGLISPGWLYHPVMGMMPFEGGTITSNNRGIVYTDEFLPLNFQLSGVQNVEIKRIAKIGPGNTYEIRDLSERRFAVAMADAHRNSWMQAAPSVGTGELNYRVDRMARTVSMYGQLDLPSGLASNLVVCFKNIGVPDPKSNVPVAVTFRNLSTGDDYLISINNEKFYESVGQLYPASPNPNVTPSPDGVRLGLRRLMLNGGVSYRSMFNFSYTY